MRPTWLIPLLIAPTLLLAACGRAPGPLADARPAAEPAAASSRLLPNGTLSAIPDELRAQAALGEKLTGQPAAYPNARAFDAYLSSLVQAIPVSNYDRAGFLAKLGVTDARSPGKQDGPTFYAVLQLPDYRPGTLVNGKEILPQLLAFDIATRSPNLFMTLIRATNASVEAPSRNRAGWKQPFAPIGRVFPNGEPAQDRYADAFEKQLRPAGNYRLLFDDDFHAGIPSVPAIDNGTYGSYAVAVSLGFTPVQAWRIAAYSNRIDYDNTPYGRTSFSPAGQMDRHFNLDRSGQDTRLVWAQRHLDAALMRAGQNAFDQAEIELGCGLHSLQDVFAHGQLTPSMHGVIGEFPDQVDYDPVAVVEATQATTSYLRIYLDRVAKGDFPPAPPEPTGPTEPTDAAGKRR